MSKHFKKSIFSHLIPQEVIEQRIFLIRAHKVMLDSHLADLYGVSTKRLNEQVRRNYNRFPADFMFQLSQEEAASLRSQFATLDRKGRGGHRKYLPYAFTEQGVAMLSGVLHSDRAVAVNVAIMRAFVKLRQVVAAHRELSAKLAELERKISKHDEDIQRVFDAIRQLMAPPDPPKRKIGFHTY